MVKFAWLVTLLGALGATWFMLAVFPRAGSAPQEAVVAAVALCVVVIPYVATRALEGLLGPAATDARSKARGPSSGDAPAASGTSRAA